MKILRLSVFLPLSASMLFACNQGDQIPDDAFQLELPVFYVERPAELYRTETPANNPSPITGQMPAGNLWVKMPGQDPVNVTDSYTAPGNNKGAGDVMSPSLNWEATKIVFTMNTGIQNGKWDIYEYTFADPFNNPNFTPSLKLVMQNGDNNTGNDFDPAYLPDGRIVFTSDRQTGLSAHYGNYGSSAHYFDENRREEALNLHIMEGNGSNIKQLSFNMADERYPAVLSDGRIVFSRWELSPEGNRNQFDLFSIYPDGSNLEVYYGSHSHTVNGATAANTIFLKTQQLPDGRLLNLLTGNNGFDNNNPAGTRNRNTYGGGDFVVVDHEGYVDINTPRPGGSQSQSAGHQSSTPGNVLSGQGLSTGGRYQNFSPVWQGSDDALRALVSWTPCRVADETDPMNIIYSTCDNGGLAARDPVYGLHLLNLSSGYFSSYLLVPATSGTVYVDPVVASKRTDLPASLPSATLDSSLVIKNAGAIHIRSVYDSNMLTGVLGANLPASQLLSSSGRADIDRLVVDGNGPVRFVRVISPMPTYDNNTIPGYKFGINNRRMRAILGYSAVEPDGSVYLEVPAEVPFAIELLDKDGRKLANTFHENWMHVIAGEVKTCNGCHEGHSETETNTLNTGFGGVITSTSGLDSAHVALAQGGETMAQVRAANDPLYGELKRDLVYADYWGTPGKSLYDANCVTCHGPAGAGGSAVAIAGTTVALVNTALANIPQMQTISLTATEIQQIVDYLADPYGVFYEVEYNDSNLANGADGLSGNAPIIQPGGINCRPTNYTDPTDQPAWTSECLIVIDYKQHIQPLWEVTRTAGACVDCHSTTDAMGALKDPSVDVAAQLDLTPSGPRFFTGNGANDMRFTSYDELVVQSQEIQLNAAGDAIIGAVDTVQQSDGMGGVINVDVPRDANFERPINSSLAKNTHLIRILTGQEATATTDHSQMMSKAEIRVLSEWIDLGTQYYNNSALAVGP